MAGKEGAPLDVLVVDDHRVFAEALAVALGRDPSLAVHVATSCDDAIEAAGRIKPAVVLMDLEMPGIGGLASTRRILEESPETRVLVVSSHQDDLVKAQAVEAGAVGYLSKLGSVDDVSAAVTSAVRGAPLFGPDEVSRLQRLLRHRRHQESTQRMRVNRLTRRQLEILQMVADGLPIREIADRLRVSPLTLRTHVQNILTRLAVHTKLEAVALAIKHGKVSVGGMAQQPAGAEMDADV